MQFFIQLLLATKFTYKRLHLARLASASFLPSTLQSICVLDYSLLTFLHVPLISSLFVCSTNTSKIIITYLPTANVTKQLWLQSTQDYSEYLLFKQI